MAEIEQSTLATAKAELAALEAEHQKWWEQAYAVAEAQMIKALEPYRCHHRRVADLKTVIRILETA